MNYESWFVTPLAADYIKEIDNERLKHYCLELNHKESGRTVSNAGGWQSEDLNLQDPILTELLNSLWHRINYMKTNLGVKDSVKLTITAMWVNINKKGNFNRPHAHPDSFLSGVYYVDSDPINGGNIVFQSPILTHGYHWDKDWFEESASETISSSNCQYKPETTKVIIFPGWVWHYVEPNNSDQDRISISFNTKLEKIYN